MSRFNDRYDKYLNKKVEYRGIKGIVVPCLNPTLQLSSQERRHIFLSNDAINTGITASWRLQNYPDTHGFHYHNTSYEYAAYMSIFDNSDNYLFLKIIDK